MVDTAARRLIAFGVTVDCAIGRGGACAAAAKREGDGCTPRGSFALRAVLLRPDRAMPAPTALPWRWLRADDGWSDDPADPAYNRPVTHTHAWSAEALWRSDGVYDIIVVIGWNDRPVVPGAGSAIFLHCTRPDFAPTEGCVAVPYAALRSILARADGTRRIEIA